MRGRRAVVAGVVSMALGLLSPAAVAATSAWTDAASVSSTLSAHTVVAPASVSCRTSLMNVTYSWSEVDSRYDYRLTIRRVDTGVVTTQRVVTGAETGATFSGLLGLGLALGTSRADLEVEVVSFLADTSSWVSVPARKGPVLRIATVAGLGLSFSC